MKTNTISHQNINFLYIIYKEIQEKKAERLKKNKPIRDTTQRYSTLNLRKILINRGLEKNI